MNAFHSGSICHFFIQNHALYWIKCRFHAGRTGLFLKLLFSLFIKAKKPLRPNSKSKWQMQNQRLKIWSEIELRRLLTRAPKTPEIQMLSFKASKVPVSSKSERIGAPRKLKNPPMSSIDAIPTPWISNGKQISIIFSLIQEISHVLISVFFILESQKTFWTLHLPNKRKSLH